MNSDSSSDNSGADAPSAGVKPAFGSTLQNHGIPWVVQIDGKDLVVRNILATCWGGKFDSGDGGQTESGVPNNGYPTAGAYPMEVSLPIRSTEVATRNSPLAFKGSHIPWKTNVKVWREADGEETAVECILIDNGPDISKFPSHALDLNPNVVLHFAPGFDPKKVANQWSEDGFSYRIIGGADHIS
jgi:hypothetical protein